MIFYLLTCIYHAHYGFKIWYNNKLISRLLRIFLGEVGIIPIYYKLYFIFYLYFSLKIFI